MGRGGAVSQPLLLAPEISARSWSVIPNVPLRDSQAYCISPPRDRLPEGQYPRRGIAGPSLAGGLFARLGYLPAIPIAGVSTAPAMMPVLAFIAEKLVVVALAEHPVPARAPDEPVFARASTQDVVAAQSANDVVASPAKDDIRPARTADRIVARGPEDRDGTAATSGRRRRGDVRQEITRQGEVVVATGIREPCRHEPAVGLDRGASAPSKLPPPKKVRKPPPPKLVSRLPSGL